MRKVSEREVLFVMQALEDNLPVDGKFKLTLRVNNQGRQCVRCEATTMGRDWLVDIYGKRFFYSIVPPGGAQTHDSIRSLVIFLQTQLLRPQC
jgi:hypothetical protein